MYKKSSSTKFRRHLPARKARNVDHEPVTRGRGRAPPAPRYTHTVYGVSPCGTVDVLRHQNIQYLLRITISLIGGMSCRYMYVVCCSSLICILSGQEDRRRGSRGSLNHFMAFLSRLVHQAVCMDTSTNDLHGYEYELTKSP